jgi:hypothetical protein
MGPPPVQKSHFLSSFLLRAGVPPPPPPHNYLLCRDKSSFTPDTNERKRKRDLLKLFTSQNVNYVCSAEKQACN